MMLYIAVSLQYLCEEFLRWYFCGSLHRSLPRPCATTLYKHVFVDSIFLRGSARGPSGLLRALQVLRAAGLMVFNLQ